VSFDKLLRTGIAFVKAQRNRIDVSISIWQCGGSSKKDLLIEPFGADSDLYWEGLKKHQLVAMTNYLWLNKRIPENLPQKLRTQVPIRFEITEETCPY